MEIKILNLNIEGDKHLSRVIKLVMREKPDAICLQEVFEEDFKVFLDKFDMRGLFAPMVFIDTAGQPGFKKRGVFGVAMMSKLTGKFDSGYYFKRRRQELPVYGGKPNAVNRALVWQKIENGPTIASTHFTWSKNGLATQKQRRELASLSKLLDKLQPDVVCGDFNAPRGARLQAPGAPATGGQGDIWTAISQKLIDNIPPEVKTTLDPNLHYAKGIDLVVDGFFTNPNAKLTVKSLKLVGGVSDHLAVSAIISWYT